MIADHNILTAKNSHKQQFVFVVAGMLILILTGIAAVSSFSLTASIVAVFVQCGLLVGLGCIFKSTIDKLPELRDKRLATNAMINELDSLRKNCSARSLFIETAGVELLEASRAMYDAAGFLNEDRQARGCSDGVEEDLLTKAGWLYSFSRDIVVLTKLKKGEMTLHEQEIDPIELVRWSVSRVQKIFGNEQIVSMMNMPGVPVLINGDLCKLKQCLTKFFSSACRQLQIDQADIKINVHADSTTGLVVLLKLSGRQLKDSEFQELCCPLDSFSNENDHIDLDMAIAVRLAKLHNGEIVVHEQTSSGTVMAFKLPPDRILIRSRDIAAKTVRIKITETAC